MQRAVACADPSVDRHYVCAIKPVYRHIMYRGNFPLREEGAPLAKICAVLGTELDTAIHGLPFSPPSSLLNRAKCFARGQVWKRI